MMKHMFLRTAGLLTALMTLSGSYLMGTADQATAQTLFESTGTIEPAVEEYPLEMEVGNAVTITMTSEEFDTVLTLIGPDGGEVAFNDDFGDTLNSQIVYSADASGTYTIIAKSFDGAGGDFDIAVRPATEYEVLYSEAVMSMELGDYIGAIAAFSDAISLDPANPDLYLGRADAYFGQAQTDLEAQGLFLEEPNDLPDDARAAIVGDFQTAAELYEADGNVFAADSLREQIQYIETGEIPEPTNGGSR